MYVSSNISHAYMLEEDTNNGNSEEPVFIEPGVDEPLNTVAEEDVEFIADELSVSPNDKKVEKVEDIEVINTEDAQPEIRDTVKVKTEPNVPVVAETKKTSKPLVVENIAIEETPEVVSKQTAVSTETKPKPKEVVIERKVVCEVARDFTDIEKEEVFKTKLQENLKEANKKRNDIIEKRLERILQYIQKNGFATNDSVERLLGVSDATSSRYLSKLVEKGKVTRSGTGMYTKYYLLS